MGILGRINSVIRSNVNDIMDKMTDPAKEVELLIHDMEKNYKEAQQEVISCTADEKKAKLRCERLEEEVGQWEQRAMQAVRAGDDPLARQALEKKASVEQELREARQTHKQQADYASQLKQSLRELDRKITDVKNRKESIKLRAKAAKEGRPGLQAGKAFAEFDRLEGQIEAIEEIEKLSETMEGREAATEAKFRRLEQQDPAVEDALAELKRKVREE